MNRLITATIAYRKYGIPRSMLRKLAEKKVVRMDERTADGRFVLKMYSESDIMRFCDGN